MPTQKVCQTCKHKIGVASRKCKQCGANQPYKEKLSKQKEKVAQEWKATQQKNHSVNKVYDSTNLLLHKWKLLERHPILLLAKRGTNGFAADCLCPWQIETEDGNNALVTIKRIYESLLNVTLAVEPATRVGEIPPLEIEGPSATQAEMAADPGSDSLSVPLLTTETDTVFTPILTPVSSGLTPPVSSGQSPPVSSGLTPPVSSGLTPPVSSGLTPPVSSGLTPPVSSSPTPTVSSVSSSQKRRPTRNKVAINEPYRGVGDVATLLWMMPTQKVCQTCKHKIGVASRKCRQCGANQPYKEKLSKQKEKVAQEWKATQQKNHSVNKVYDSTNLLLHKWKLLEQHRILLLAKRGTNGFAADCLCPWQIEDGNNALLTCNEGNLNCPKP